MYTIQAVSRSPRAVVIAREKSERTRAPYILRVWPPLATTYSSFFGRLPRLDF